MDIILRDLVHEKNRDVHSQISLCCKYWKFIVHITYTINFQYLQWITERSYRVVFIMGSYTIFRIILSIPQDVINQSEGCISILKYYLKRFWNKNGMKSVSYILKRGKNYKSEQIY